MNEEQIKAAKAAWHRDPETAAQALLGMSAEEVFVQALRGCNQHKHKPGCPHAEGSGKKRAKWVDEWEKAAREKGSPLSYWDRDFNTEMDMQGHDYLVIPYAKLTSEVMMKGYKEKTREKQNATINAIRERELKRAKTPKEKQDIETVFKVLKSAVFDLREFPQEDAD